MLVSIEPIVVDLNVNRILTQMLPLVLTFQRKLQLEIRINGWSLLDKTYLVYAFYYRFGLAPPLFLNHHSLDTKQVSISLNHFLLSNAPRQNILVKIQRHVPVIL